MFRYNFPHRIELRREEAVARNEKYAKMTTRQKLDKQLEQGFAGRQYDKLLKKLEKETASAKVSA